MEGPHQAHKEAAFYYGHCVALQPSNAEVYHNLGQIEMRLNQHPSAIRSLEAATRLRPVWAEAYFNKGLACGRKSHTGAVAFQTATQLAKHPQCASRLPLTNHNPETFIRRTKS